MMEFRVSRVGSVLDVCMTAFVHALHASHHDRWEYQNFRGGLYMTMYDNLYENSCLKVCASWHSSCHALDPFVCATGEYTRKNS